MPFGGWGKEREEEMTAAKQTRRASEESQTFPDSFPLALLSCGESKKIIKALIYLYIFSIDVIDPTIAAS